VHNQPQGGVNASIHRRRMETRNGEAALTDFPKPPDHGPALYAVQFCIAGWDAREAPDDGGAELLRSGRLGLLVPTLSDILGPDRGSQSRSIPKKLFFSNLSVYGLESIHHT
jgi:hypothetical protein